MSRRHRLTSPPAAAVVPAPVADWRRHAVLACFLVSGMTGLAYQVVWTRMLTLVFGATVLAVGSVLASYMAGLALGSWYWSRRADATTRPLRLYALLEAGVALSALLTPLLFTLVQQVYRGLFVGGLSDFSALSLVRFLLCLPVLLLPTFLMGGTLPVLARFYASGLDRIGRGAGDLYGINTLGAVLGTLLAGFVLLPVLGVPQTLWAAAVVNLAVAVVAYLLSRRDETVPVAEPAPAQRWAGADLPLAVVLVGFALSGCAAMILEVAWTRALIQIFGNSTYAFTTMLAAFLIGLAAGAALCGRWIDRAATPFFVFAMLELAAGLWAAVATPLIEWLPPVFLRAYSAWGGNFAALQLTQFVVCCLLMLPTTLALGALFPTVSRLFSARAGGAGTSVGVPYAANTVGTVVGALLGGFVLLPRLGIELSLLAAVLAYLAVWLAVLVTSRQSVLPASRHVALGALALVACARLAWVPLDPQTMAAGVYMYPEYFLKAQSHAVPLAQVFRLQKVLYHREGYACSVAVMQLPSGDIALQTNGKTDASTGDLSTQRALAHLPLLLKPDARDVLVVGLASGCTAGSVLRYPVQRVDCVEIEPAMLEAARFFDGWNHNCLQDPRFHAVLQDARNYVFMSDRRYDVITAEPTNPWIAGVNNLFTVEYFRHCARRLQPGGLMCQWFPAYNLRPDELRTALASFRQVFPHVTVWSFSTMRTDFFALGSQEPLAWDPLRAARLIPGFQQDLTSMRVFDATQLAASLLLDEPSLERFCAEARLNTDAHPLLEFSTPRHLYDETSKAATMQQAYAGGAGSVLPLTPEQGRALLGGLSPEVQVTAAALLPRRLNPVQPIEAADLALLRLQVRVDGFPATLLYTGEMDKARWAAMAEVEPQTTQPSLPGYGAVEERDGLLRGSFSTHNAGRIWEVPAGPSARDQLTRLRPLVTVGGE